MAGQAPREEEGVPNVLVGAAEKLMDAGMHHVRDPVDEDHDLVLQDLGRVGEIPDVAETEDGLHAPPGDHGVQRRAVAALHVEADDLGAGLAEPQGEQRADLDDRFLEDHRLHGLRNVLRPLVLRDAHRGQHPPPELLHDRLLGRQLRHHRSGVVPVVEAVALPHARAADLLLLVLLVADGHGLERVVPDSVQLGDHALDRRQHQLVRVAGEGHGPEAQ
mmetsp:Transcript_10788/g.31943  ORF Transcript_10788/g.31943 Transcript_10788/m.31943 type:complete len:219 (+) Transcript_10788:821-1477(+)